MPIKAVTEVTKPDEVEDGFAKGCALIRANLHVDVDKIKTEQEWAQLYCQPCGWNNGATATTQSLSRRYSARVRVSPTLRSYRCC
ncbi:MAG: hypothetical protein HDR99_07220 [Bacteroides sp.]|nr:hypothetical protein [Bacteroides sp.]